MSGFLKGSQELPPKFFQDLIGKKKTWLLEVACSPESRLSQEVQRLAGYEEAAVRCSHWNNFDLETSEGVKGVLRMIDELDPQHVWISPVCGPTVLFSRSTKELKARLDELAAKRKRAFEAVHWGQLHLSILHPKGDSHQLGMVREMSGLETPLHATDAEEIQSFHQCYPWLQGWFTVPQNSYSSFKKVGK